MTMTNSLKRRFVKDYSLPIHVVRDPYFEYFLKLYERDYESNTKFEKFFEMVERLGGEEAYFTEATRVTDSLIYDIKHHIGYQEFNESDLSRFDVKDSLKQGNLYIIPNDGKTFVSVDMKHANFQAFDYAIPDWSKRFGSTYKEMLTRYTDEDYFHGSKYIRQVIFGNVNPKRQQKIQKYLMTSVVFPVLNQIFMTEDLASSTNDELVFECKDESKFDLIPTMINGIKLRKEIFHLHQIGDKKYFVKDHFDDQKRPEFKAVPGHYFAECFKKYYDLPLHDYDRLVHVDGRLARFEEPLFEALP